MTLKVFRVALALVATAMVVVTVWVDISTDLWREYVVLSDLAAGIVTFALIALVIDRLIARATHERWAPVTRVALGDLRRRLVAEDSPDEFLAVRRLPTPDEDPRTLDELIEAAAAERDALAGVLARWASFLSASADVLNIMDAIAEVSERLDTVDSTAKIMRKNGASTIDELRGHVDAYHRAGGELLARIAEALREYEKLTVSSDVER